MSDEDICLYEVKGKLAIITLNRPPVHAFNLDLMKSLNEKLNQAENDDNVTCILLKSSGTRVFSAGIDIKASKETTLEYHSQVRKYGRDNTEKIITMKKPVVCQIQGSAIGYGMMLLMACDLRIFAERPMEEMFFRFPEIDLGIYPQTGATILPLYAFGLSYAKQLLLTADNIGLEQLKNMNLATRIFPLNALESETLKFSKTLSKRLIPFLFLIKSTLHIMYNKNISRWFDLEDECGKIAYQKKSVKELDDLIKDLYTRYP